MPSGLYLFALVFLLACSGDAHFKNTLIKVVGCIFERKSDKVWNGCVRYCVA